ncbi:MAG: hypothetical protein UY07_C0002G0024 [Parcubacteria group bacterium GW2011_GWA1_47_8]|nr:MAG: hypothetical protein UY07_C0002G0024 [Parcubacteria group bacterium GW2011_GWA1_47_8]
MSKMLIHNLLYPYPAAFGGAFVSIAFFGEGEYHVHMERLKTTPKDFFIHLGVLVSLYISVISILTLIFSIIDQVFPKEFSYTDPYAGGVSLAMAMLLVAFPLCVLFTRALSKEERIFPEKRNLWARKAITYCTLFIAILVVAIDLIVLLNSFFSGEEITMAFGLKIFSIIVVIGTVAGYYLYDLRRKPEDDGARVRTRYTYSALAVIVLAFGLGFYVMGSPYTQKQKRFDAERVSHLQMIQNQIIPYWQTKNKLPMTLKDLEDPISGFMMPVDPDNKSPYEYVVTGKFSFQLCATFGRESPLSASAGIFSEPALPYKNVMDENWKHGVGKVCFERTIDPERYELQKGLLPTPTPFR